MAAATLLIPRFGVWGIRCSLEGIKRGRRSGRHHVAIRVWRTVDVPQLESPTRCVEDQCAAIVRDPIYAQVGKLGHHGIVSGIPGLDVPRDEG
jgi:hypothetical protein